jgi:hypothetical protein
MFCTSLFVILTFCFWAFYCLSFLRSLIAPFVLRFTVSDCRFRPSIYTLWLPRSSFDLQSLIAPFVLRFTVLILIYDRSVVFSCFSGFIHQKNWPPRWGSRCSIFLVVVFCRSLFLLLHCLPPITPFVSSIFFVHMYSRIGHAFATRSFNIIILVSAMVY